MANLTLTQILTRMASDLKQYFARLSHTHPASDIASGTLDAGRIPSLDASKIGSGTLGTARGGTGITSNPSMLTDLGSTSAASVFGSSPRPGVTGTLAVAHGGTGGTSAASARTNLDAAQADGATGTLALAETAIGNLESSIAPVEATTAKTNHAVGDYFMLGNVLMCATAAIATGEQITTSNATPATVQGQIDTLRDSVSMSFGSVTWNTANVSGDATRRGWQVKAGIAIVSLEFTPLSGRIVGGYQIAAGLPAPMFDGTSVFGGNSQQMRVTADGSLVWYFPSDTTTLRRIDTTLVYLTSAG